MTETVNVLTQFIQNTGFPIAVCCYLLYSQQRMSEIIERNTTALVTLCKILGKEEVLTNDNE